MGKVGRPKKPVDPNARAVTISAVDGPTWDRAKVHAARSKETIGSLVSRAIRNIMATETEAQEV